MQPDFEAHCEVGQKRGQESVSPPLHPASDLPIRPQGQLCIGPVLNATSGNPLSLGAPRSQAIWSSGSNVIRVSKLGFITPLNECLKRILEGLER